MAALFLVVALSLAGSGAQAQDDAEYRLAEGDRVSMRVLSWNALSLQFETFAALAGTFGVDPRGDLSLPLLGSVPAAGQSPAALSQGVAELYRSRLGLPEMPSVTMEVTEFGPVFVLGDVARPGSYEFVPGMTVIQSMALAGGIYRLTDARPDGASSVIRAAGSLDEIGVDLARSRMIRERLTAEAEDRTTFERPDLPVHPAGAEAQDALFIHEQSLFDSRLQRQQRALAAIEESRALLQTEVAALESKLAGVERQLELIRESVGNMESLLDRGLARSPALVTLQRTQIDLEARELDTQTAIFRARQQLSDLDRDASDLTSGRQLQVLQELQTTEAQIDRLEARRSMTRRLLAGAEALLGDAEKEVRTDLVFAILRGGGSEQVSLPAVASTVLKPRDVLVVTMVTAVE